MFKNNEKGITLVVLIITVVVLLILSGVTISMIVTDNGIINKTQKAKQNVEDVTTDTQTRLNELYSQGTYIDEIYGTIEDLEDINDEYEEFRRAIAESIGQAGGESPDYTAAASVYREKINGILSKATELNEDIAATSEDISEGKKAWVNGEMITGIGTTETEISNIKLIGSKYYNYPSSSVSFNESFTDEDISKAKGFIVSRQVATATTGNDFAANASAIAIKINGGFVVTSGNSFYGNRSLVNSVNVNENTVTFNISVWNSQASNYYYLFY